MWSNDPGGVASKERRVNETILKFEMAVGL